MQVRSLGYSITDVPGIESIEVRPVNGHVDTLIKFSFGVVDDNGCVNFGVDELSQFRDAIAYAEDRARRLRDEIEGP